MSKKDAAREIYDDLKKLGIIVDIDGGLLKMTPRPPVRIMMQLSDIKKEFVTLIMAARVQIVSLK